MNRHLINWEIINEYEGILGTNKLCDLWKDYLEQAENSWKIMDGLSLEEKRLTFHNWRSNSQVFGMMEFADNCALIEEAIVNHHNLDKLDDMIKQSRLRFQVGVAELKSYFKKVEVE